MRIQGVTLTGTRVVDASVVTQNLAIWIDANNSSSYGGSGTTITDLSGNSRTQNLSSAAAYTMFNGVKCWDCGVDGYYIRGATATPQLPTSGFTYIAWAKVITSSTGWRTLYRTTPDDHPLLVQISADNLGMYDNSTNSFYDSGYDVTAVEDVWAQYAITGDSAGQTYYINGQQVGTTTQTAAGNYHDQFGGLVGQPFGKVANMFLYTTKLTAEQIKQNYYNQLPKFTLPDIATSNLVLWYDPSFATSYPGSGTAVTNLAGTALNGTMSNITYTNPYFTYNGSSSQVAIADNAALEPGTGDWTMEVWVNQSVATGSQTILGKFDPGGLSADISYAIRVLNGNVRADYSNGSTSISTANYALPANTWTQLVYVFTNVANNNVITYVNGVQQSTTTHSFASILNTSANLYLGSYNNGEYPQWFNGRIGVTRLYSSALSAADVLKNYNADKGKYGL